MTFSTKIVGGMRLDVAVNLDEMPADQLALLRLENDLLLTAQAAASARAQLARSAAAGRTDNFTLLDAATAKRPYIPGSEDPDWIGVKTAAHRLGCHERTAWRRAEEHFACWPHGAARRVDFSKLRHLCP